MHIHSVVRAALAACALSLLFIAPAGAANVTTELRVEAEREALAPGWRYAHDSIRYRTSRSDACDGSGDAARLEGPTALGLLIRAARSTRPLRPVQISDQFDFGPFVCGVGEYPATDDGFWLYKVDHVAPEVGAGDFAISRSHAQVLWYFSNSATGANTGNELALVVPARVQAGRDTTVRVLEYDFAGDASPAAGVRLIGAGGGAMTGPDGRATVVFDKPGRRAVRGVRGDDIPTEARRICVWEETRSECDRVRVARLVGTPRADLLRGDGRPEVIVGGRGPDRIVARDGTQDAVRCGRGRDRVWADLLDRVARNCERVKRR